METKLIGQKVSHYRIVEKIGAGGMGVVFRAMDERLDREVAVKFLKKDTELQQDRLLRFEQETRTIGSLNHPNILSLYDLGDVDGMPFIVTELLVGETLRDLIRKESLTIPKTIEYGAQIARGLAAAHDQGIHHRDLKPENIFVTADGVVKILDFGLAKLHQSDEISSYDTASPTRPVLTDPGMIMGTVSYMSPEQVKGISVDHRSDIFSLGLVLFEMISGYCAFQKETSVETMTAVLKEETPVLKSRRGEVPPFLQRLISHCLEKRPEDRYQSARDIAFSLDTLSLTSGSQAIPRIKTNRSFSPYFWPIVSLCLLVLTAVSFWMQRGSHSNQQPIYQQLTHRRGVLTEARFAPDGQNIVFSANWDGAGNRVFLKRLDSPTAALLNLPPAVLLDVSSRGDMAVLLSDTADNRQGALIVTPILGGTQREVTDRVLGATWDPPGAYLAVARHTEQLTTLIEYPPGNEIYRTDEWITDPRFSPSGDWIAFCQHPFNYDDRGVLVLVDLNGNARELTPTWSSIGGIDWKDSKEIWFTALSRKEQGWRALYAVNLAGDIRRVLNLPSYNVLFDVEQGRTLMDLALVKVGIKGKMSSGEEEEDLSWLSGSYATDLNDKGELLFLEMTGNADDYVVAIRDPGGTITEIGRGMPLALSPDGENVLSARLAPNAPLELWSIRSSEPRLLPTDLNVSSARFFADGKRAALIGSEKAETGLYILDLEDGSLTRIATGIVIGRRPARLRISPDSKWIATESTEGGLRLFASDGSGSKELKGSEPSDYLARWGRMGETVQVYKREMGKLTVFEIDLKTGDRKGIRVYQPKNPEGILFLADLMIRNDDLYAYSYFRQLSNLYIIDGLN